LPVVLRRAAGRAEILAFRHPTAGYQLVKGTIEAAETIQHAAERELLEESGIVGHAIDYLGAVQMSEPEQEWHFVVCQIEEAVETWTHQTSDGGGLEFQFFWHPLSQSPTRIGIRFSSRLFPLLTRAESAVSIKI
jgi:8-oxo-dGTP pyrophosphatase MutT (NUDIX family)